MTPTDSDRTLTLKFDGEAAAGGRVPVSVLADKLKAFQTLLFHAAATVAHDSQGRRGQWTNRYRDAVELRFAEAREGSLVIEADLTKPPPDLLGERDLGLKAVDLTFEAAGAIRGRNYQALASAVPDRQERTLLLRQFESLAPREGEALSLTLANGVAGHDPFRLTGETRAVAQRFLYRDAVTESGHLEEARVVGTLTKIHYGVGDEKLSVHADKGAEVWCHYGPDLRDHVANLCAGSVVEVNGFGTLTRGGKLARIDVVTDLEVVSTEPIRIARFEHGGAIYKLRESVAFEVEFADGVWIYSNERLRLWGYADKREEALAELAEAFDDQYREIALEEDAALDLKAVQLKHRLLDLVESGPTVGTGGG